MAVLALLAGCAPAAVVPPPGSPGPGRLQGKACLDALTQRGIVYQLVSEHAAVNACNLAGAVRVSKLQAPFDKPAEMTCEMALKLDEFETNVVQPAALRYFNRRVTLVRQFGAYSCRNVNGTRRLSEHARGQAIDIGGFELDGGMTISVKEHWRGAGARSNFLREVARGACGIFRVVLTPKSNREHRDHMHLDLGPYPLCDA